VNAREPRFAEPGRLSLPASGNFQPMVHRHLINGQWSASADARTIATLAPATGQVIGHLARGGEVEVDAAVAAARAALEGAWGRTTAAERGRLLMKLSARVAEDIERLAWIEAHDTGKPISTARNDIHALVRYFEFYAGAADKVHGQVIPFLDGYDVKVVREPHGVTAHIIPWNYPAQMFGRTLAPALAMGNATVMKPSEEACLSALEVAALAMEVGFPPGTINIVTGYGPEAGAALSGHPGIDFVTFTGSPEAGAKVQAAAAPHSVPVVLELGGKSPQVVFADADLDRAALVVTKAIVQNAGQTCSAGSRVLVERSVHDAFMARVVKHFHALKIGQPSDDGDLGPVINARQRERVMEFIEQAKADGTPVLAQAKLPETLPSGGQYVPPTVFGPVDPMSRIAQREVFGPVLASIPFDTEEEAVRIANGTEYGLVASVWTRDGDRQARLAKRIRAGQLFINCYGAGGGIELPFGGTKRSGHGREKGFAALEEMSTTKTVVHLHG
jgi:aldehyde dehydrogenase (NAD+)